MAAIGDEALVAAFLAGDDRAFDVLVDRYAKRVFAICFRYFQNEQDAEDAAQNTFLTVYRRATTYSGAAAFSTWVYRVATNACHDLARRQARRPRTIPLDAEPHRVQAVIDDQALDRLAAAELGGELSAALRQLEPEQREAVILRDLIGCSYAEIAQRTGVAAGTAKSRVHRGHARLSELLESTRNQSVPRDPPTGEKPAAAEPGPRVRASASEPAGTEQPEAHE